MNNAITVQKYIINGKEYSSYDDIPDEYKAYLKSATPQIQKEGYVTISNSQNLSTISHKLIYFALSLVSLAQGEAINSLSRVFGLTSVNPFVFRLTNIIIGLISTKLAEIGYQKAVKNQIKLSQTIGKLQSQVYISTISSGYAFMLNIAVFLILYYF